jgi:hypothetical protein
MALQQCQQPSPPAAAAAEARRPLAASSRLLMTTTLTALLLLVPGAVAFRSLAAPASASAGRRARLSPSSFGLEQQLVVGASHQRWVGGLLDRIARVRGVFVPCKCMYVPHPVGRLVIFVSAIRSTGDGRRSINAPSSSTHTHLIKSSCMAAH